MLEYRILQYVNQCWESENEWKYKWEKREFMLVYALRQILMSSNSNFQFDKKLLKTTVDTLIFLTKKSK
jgi:hypothetical protein